MADLFEYFGWRGDLSPSQAQICDVDRMILCELAYLDFRVSELTSLTIICREMLEHLRPLSPSQKKKLLHYKQDERLLEEISKVARFEKMLVGDFVSEFDPMIEVQFAAMTVILSDDTVACVFRGTDRSVIGWKEDLNMAYCDTLPSQERALRYLESVGEKYKCPIRVMGHSKGGNLAIYSAAHCKESLASRIMEVTSLDGPGFGEHIINGEGYRRISDRTRTILPRSSIVGTLLSNTGRFSIIESRGSALAQHNLYNWEIMGAELIKVAERDGTSQLVSSAINEWISKLEPETRKKFIDTVWSLLANTDIVELGELIDGKHTIAMIKNYNSLDDEAKKLISETLARLKDHTKQSLRDLIEQSKK